MVLIDISLRVHPAMLAWPTGRPPARHEVIDEGTPESPRNSTWELDSHAGTHVDAPLHWLPGEASVDRLPLEPFLGPCTVVGVDGDRPVEGGDLPDAALRPGSRVLLRTGNSERRIASAEFDPGFAAIAESAADRLAAAGVALVGIDYLSVESPSGDGGVHRRLLGAGVALLEGLDLSAVEPGDYMLSALPVRLAAGEAAPVRAVLWRERR